MGNSKLFQSLEANWASKKSDASDNYRNCKGACPILCLHHMLCCYCSRVRRWSCLSAQTEFTICSLSQRYVALKQCMSELLSSFVRLFVPCFIPWFLCFVRSLTRSFVLYALLHGIQKASTLTLYPALPCATPHHRLSSLTPPSYSTLLLCVAFRCPAFLFFPQSANPTPPM